VKSSEKELPMSRKIVSQKQYHIPGRNAELNITIKDLRDAHVVIFSVP
jgi:hypothetical protein